jgi:SPX domain protein involved in polyphosphate accumulation
MSRLTRRAAGLLAVLAPAALLASGCGALSGIKDGVDAGVNTVEVCNSVIDLYNGHLKKVEDASNKLTSAKPSDTAAAVTAYNKTVADEFTALHTGLGDQVKKIKDDKVKSALTELDTHVATIAAKPESFAADGAANAKKLDEIAAKLNTACGAKDQKKK